LETFLFKTVCWILSNCKQEGQGAAAKKLKKRETAGEKNVDTLRLTNKSTHALAVFPLLAT
jgi:hypothetical protein